LNNFKHEPGYSKHKNQRSSSKLHATKVLTGIVGQFRIVAFREKAKKHPQKRIDFNTLKFGTLHFTTRTTQTWLAAHAWLFLGFTLVGMFFEK
jgi:hypothetical protein